MFRNPYFLVLSSVSAFTVAAGVAVWELLQLRQEQYFFFFELAFIFGAMFISALCGIILYIVYQRNNASRDVHRPMFTRELLEVLAEKAEAASKDDFLFAAGELVRIFARRGIMKVVYDDRGKPELWLDRRVSKHLPPDPLIPNDSTAVN